MNDQMRWHLLLDSKRSMLKFRLPWTPGITTYLDGDLRLPIFGPGTTTESRLITCASDPSAITTYDNSKYEQQMFHFNVVTRIALYSHPVDGGHIDGDSLCHCFDCTSEVPLAQIVSLSSWTTRDWSIQTGMGATQIRRSRNANKEISFETHGT